MALNATLGAIDANSYVTLAEAEIYFTDRMHASAWGALTDEIKSSLLISGSQMLDWYVKWKGDKTTTTQSMQWPRADVICPSGVEIDDNVLPPEVRTATYEQAFANIADDRTIDDPLAGIGELRAGSLKIKSGPEKPNQTNAKPIPAHVYSILSDLHTSGGTVWLLRA